MNNYCKHKNIFKKLIQTKYSHHGWFHYSELDYLNSLYCKNFIKYLGSFHLSMGLPC